MDWVEGEVAWANLKGFKGTPPKFNAQGQMTQAPKLVVTLELPNDAGLARHLARLTREGEPVQVTIEAGEPKQGKLGLEDDRGTTMRAVR